MGPERPTSKTVGPKTRKAKLHWHIMLTHFPISTAAGAFLFMGLHLFTGAGCYVLAAYVSLVAAAVVTIPTTATGWFTWKRSYKGSKSRLFLEKIWASAAMIAVSIALVAYQTLHPFTRINATHNLAHAVYLGGVVLLMVAAVMEGHWGGRLHHY